jgi:N-acetylneuraminic acid mutarotase
MRHRPWLLFPLALSVLVLTSCGDEPTQPIPRTDQASVLPANAQASDTWLMRRSRPTERDYVVTAMVPNAEGQSVLYVIGGAEPFGRSLSVVEAYNVATNSWSRRQDLPIALASVNGAGVIGGKIYVAGGHKRVRWGPTVYLLFVYDPVRNTWTQKRGMPEHGAEGVAGVIGNQLYVSVPSEDQRDHSFFFRYDPATNQWATLPSPSHNYNMGGVLYGKLYLVGNQVEAYDPATNQWTVKASPPASDINTGGSAAAAGAKLYVFGGQRTLVYDPTGDTWSVRTPGSGGGVAARVFLNGKPRIELIPSGTDNWQYVP